MTAVEIVETPPEEGCSDCGNQQTVQLHPFRGRLCPHHVLLPTIPAGPYRHDLGLEMVDLGRPDAALAYLRAWARREVDARFDAAAARLAVAR